MSVRDDTHVATMMERHDTIGNTWAGETIDGRCAGLARATQNSGMHCRSSVPEECSAEEPRGHKAVLAVFIIVVRGVVVVVVIVITSKMGSK
jgi:hypothetical protein